MIIHSRVNWKNIAKSFVPNNNDMPTRRYDLDWLRVLVLGYSFYIIRVCFTLKVGAGMRKAFIVQSYSKTLC